MDVTSIRGSGQKVWYTVYKKLRDCSMNIYKMKRTNSYDKMHKITTCQVDAFEEKMLMSVLWISVQRVWGMLVTVLCSHIGNLKLK